MESNKDGQLESDDDSELVWNDDELSSSIAFVWSPTKFFFDLDDRREVFLRFELVLCSTNFWLFDELDEGVSKPSSSLICNHNNNERTSG